VAIAEPTYQAPLEDGLVSKPIRSFYLSSQINITGGTDLFYLEQRGPRNNIEAFTPTAIVDGVSGNHVDFPLNPANDSASQMAHNPREEIDQYIFQWMLVPVECWSGAACTPTATREILEPRTKNGKTLFLDSAGTPFFSTVEDCTRYNVEQSTNTPVGWQCLSGQNLIGSCQSVTKSSLVSGHVLHKNIGACLEECEGKHKPTDVDTEPVQGSKAVAKKNDAVAKKNDAVAKKNDAVAKKNDAVEIERYTANDKYINEKTKKKSYFLYILLTISIILYIIILIIINMH
jgi:hypothetical protein